MPTEARGVGSAGVEKQLILINFGGYLEVEVVDDDVQIQEEGVEGEKQGGERGGFIEREGVHMIFGCLIKLYKRYV